MQSTIKSNAMYERLCEVIPGGVNSPVRACKAVGQLPLVAERGALDMVYDVDGNGYIDYCMSWGALIHGHAHPDVTSALIDQVKKGTSFGITTPMEEALARKVIELMPAIEQVRFVSSGTEATMSAVRLARAYTGKDLVVKFNGNYHGHADFFLVQAGSGVMHLNQTSSSKGIPSELVKHTLSLPFNDEKAALALFSDPELSKKIACVILEPVAGNMGVVAAKKSFVQMLQEQTKKLGALLIFDEVMTCFRVAKGGASFLYGIKPDLICLGKIVGGGLPAAAFGGRKEIMQYLAPVGSVYQAGTLSGNPLAMVAGLKTLSILEEKGFYEELERKTALIVKPVADFIEKNQIQAYITSVGSMLTLFFGVKSVQNVEEAKLCDTELFGKFFRFLFERGVYIPPLQQEAWFISMAHTDEHLNKTAELILEFLKQK